MDAKYLGFDLSTTKLAVGVTASDGEEGFASVPMAGATKWLGEPAFDLNHLPIMIVDVLEKLEKDGWEFSQPGSLSFSVRQHDMAVLDKFNDLLMPALSWQCNAAKERTKWINKTMPFEALIGKVEERFILPKALWVLDQQPDLRPKIGKVMTTGDYIAFRLTGVDNLSTSDAYCNGLLDKSTKLLAGNAIFGCGLLPDWFPQVVDSGSTVGLVRIESDDWRHACQKLSGWEVIACLGDNHSGAVGCGLNSDSTIVVSAGTSGTVVRIGHQGDERLGEAACFEYYDEEMLLMMMARCGDWYEDFRKRFGNKRTFKAIDQEIESFITAGHELDLVRVTQAVKGGVWQEVYPADWGAYAFANQAASVQASIALELLLLVKKMLVEVVDAKADINKVVLTGNQSQSSFFREVFAVGLEMLQPGLKLSISDHQGPLAYKAAALGAMINAVIGESGGNIADHIRKHCPTSEVKKCNYQPALISGFLQKHLQ